MPEPPVAARRNPSLNSDIPLPAPRCFQVDNGLDLQDIMNSFLYHPQRF